MPIARITIYLSSSLFALLVISQ